MRIARRQQRLACGADPALSTSVLAVSSGQYQSAGTRVRSERPTGTGPSAPGSGGCSGIRRNDTDRPVGFEGRKLHLLDRVEPMLAECGIHVEEVEALPDELRQEPGTVAPNDCRPGFEEPADERTAQSESGDASVDDEEREDHDEPAGDRLIGPGDRRLQRVRSKQDEGEIEECELAYLAFAEEAEGAEEDHVDERSPNHELERWRTERPRSAGPRGSMASETMMRQLRLAEHRPPDRRAFERGVEEILAMPFSRPERADQVAGGMTYRHDGAGPGRHTGIRLMKSRREGSNAHALDWCCENFRPKPSSRPKSSTRMTRVS